MLSELDRADLDAVSAAQQLFKPEPLGENATRDFLLRTVFRLDPAQIQSEAELLRALLRRHYSSKVVPQTLDDRLIHLLRSTGRWQDWPLNQIVPGRASFLEFLQERWPIFLRRRLDDQAGDLREELEPFVCGTLGPRTYRSITMTFGSTLTTFLPMDCCFLSTTFRDLLSKGLGWRSVLQGPKLRTAFLASGSCFSYWSPIVRRRTAIIMGTGSNPVGRGRRTALVAAGTHRRGGQEPFRYGSPNNRAVIPGLDDEPLRVPS